jgi:hypothetical protein
MARACLPLLSALLVAAFAACEPGIDDRDAPSALAEARLGWIELKREIVPSVADPLAPQVYVYTLRMADGSSLVFHETIPATGPLN